MPFCFCPLRSGSSGNALFVQAGNFRVLVDAGLSVRAAGAEPGDDVRVDMAWRERMGRFYAL